MGTNYNPRIVTDGLALCLDAANPRSYPASGTSWNDLVSNNNGIMTNGPVYSNTNNGIISFDGVDDYVDCGPATFLGPSLTGLTVSCWFLISNKRTSMILENGTSFTNNTFYMALENTNNFSFLVYGAEGYDRIYGTNSYNTGVWYNFTATWETGIRCKAFVNGVETSQSPAGTTVNTLISGNTNLFAGLRPGPSIPFEGSISNFSIYNRALSEVEVKQNFEAHRNRYNI